MLGSNTYLASFRRYCPQVVLEMVSTVISLSLRVNMDSKRVHTLFRTSMEGAAEVSDGFCPQIEWDASVSRREYSADNS